MWRFSYTFTFIFHTTTTHLPENPSHRSWPSVCEMHTFWSAVSFFSRSPGIFSWSKVIFSLDGCVFRIMAFLSCLIFFLSSLPSALLSFPFLLPPDSKCSFPTHTDLSFLWTTRCMRRGYRDFRPLQPAHTQETHQTQIDSRGCVCECRDCN